MSETSNEQQQQQGGEAPAAAAAAGAGAGGDAAASKKSARVSFKVSGGTQFSLDVEEDWSVRTLKEKCQEKTDIPVAAQRLIYKGRILKDDDLISSQGLKDGHIMHLVKSVAAAAATNTQQQPQQQQQQQQPAATPAAAIPTPSAAPGGGPPLDAFLQSMLSGGMGGMGGGAPMAGGAPMGFPMGGPEMAQMMQSPFFQQAMDSLLQNPQTFRSLVENVPALRPMLPMMQGLLDNPERMRALFNPQMMQASLQMQQAMQQMRGPQPDGSTDPAAAGGAPGAPPNFLAALQAATAGMNPAAGAGMGAPGVGAPAAGGVGAPGGGAPAAGNPMASLGSGNAFATMMQQAEEMMRNNPELVAQLMQAVSSGGPAAGRQGAAAGGAPNPFAAFGSMGPMAGMFPAAPADTRPPEERFASQLQSLTDMGFIDRDANIAALQETNGDVNAAITRLLERGLGN